jgi:hypothetical protein
MGDNFIELFNLHSNTFSWEVNDEENVKTIVTIPC